MTFLQKKLTTMLQTNFTMELVVFKKGTLNTLLVTLITNMDKLKLKDLLKIQLELLLMLKDY